MNCPPGHVLKDKMCTIAPTMMCPAGYDLINGMCMQTPMTATATGPDDEMMMMRRRVQQDTYDTMLQKNENVSAGTNKDPVAPMTKSECPEGFSLNSSDNMCYPL
jgi:hypothetical protein